MAVRTYVRCDDCSRRYPVTSVERGDNQFMPRGWTRSGISIVCRRCSKNTKTSKQVTLIKNTLPRGKNSAGV